MKVYSLPKNDFPLIALEHASAFVDEPPSGLVCCTSSEEALWIKGYYNYPGCNRLVSLNRIYSPSPGCPVPKHGEDQPPPKATARQGWRQATATYPTVALAVEDGKPGLAAP